MPIFELEANGKTFEIEAPDVQAAVSAFHGFAPQPAMLSGEAKTAQSARGGQPYTGSVLPFSRDAQGKVSFDSNAGIVGSIKRAFNLPGDVASGRTPIVGEDGRTSPEVIGRSAELATLASPVNPAVRAGDMAVAGTAKALTPGKPPTATALKDAASAGYDAARGMGVDVRGSAVGELARGVRGSLEQDGVIAELAPKTFAILEKIANPPNESVATIANLEAVRRALGNAAKDFTNPTERLAATRAIAGLDRWLAEELPAHSVAGPAAAAAAVLKDARGNYAAAQRSNKITGELDDAITGAVERGDLSASVANSGQNVGNSIRQRLAAILKSPKETAGYSAGELKAMEGVVRGSRTANTARYVGNWLGGGGGMGQMLTTAVGAGAGGAAGGGLGAAIGASLPIAVGASSKALANALTKGAANKVDELVRSRSPLHESSPGVVISPEKRAALIRALMLEQQPQQ